MIDFSIERIGIVAPRTDKQEVDDYFILKLFNMSAADVELNQLIEIGLTDSNNNRPAYAADDLCDGSTAPPGLLFHKNCRPGQDVVYVQARGILKPNDTRTIGLKVIRHGLIDEHNGDLQYDDPSFLADHENLQLSWQSASHTVVFPIDDDSEIQCLQITAPKAKFVSGRTAMWELSPRPGDWQRVRASLVTGGLPIAAVLDSCMCLLLACKAESAANPRADVRTQLQEIQQALKNEESHWDGRSFDNACLALSHVLSSSLSERDRSIAVALSEIRALYKNCHKDKPKLSTVKEVCIAQESLERRLLDLKNQHSIKLPVPGRFRETLRMILMFSQSLRKSPYDWSKDCSEKAFQNRLHQFLCDTQNPVEREVDTGLGRVDFFLINTPVELKATPLKDNPMKTAAQHGQQAADYASVRGYGVGILLILDTQDRTAIKAHRPHFSEECSVGVFSSMSSVGGSSNTIVVTITTMAFPPLSSSMKTPLKSLSHI